jgi:glucokinase
VILAGDIGATKVLLEIGRMEADRWRPAFGKRYATAEFADFESVLRSFLLEFGARRGNPQQIRVACFGVAGPESGNRVQMTNLAWNVDGDAIARRFGISRVRVVNDFAAAAAGIELLEPADLVTLQAGEPLSDAPRLVIGAGSGLGVACLVPVEGGYRIVAGEAGHAGFAPANAEQMQLWLDLHERLGRVTAEDVLSGPGLAGIFGFICRAEGKSPAAVLPHGATPAGIVHAALERGDPICIRALELFVSCYGSIAGDHALALMARGGVFIAGGIAPRILSRLLAGGFGAAFNDKGSYSSVVGKMPVLVVTNEGLGVLGAAATSGPFGKRG